MSNAKKKREQRRNKRHRKMMGNQPNQEQQELEIVANQMNKLRRKIETQMDPFTDMLEALTILREIITKRLNSQANIIKTLNMTITELTEQMVGLKAEISLNKEDSDEESDEEEPSSDVPKVPDSG